jgi:hypothetical protein
MTTQMLKTFKAKYKGTEQEFTIKLPSMEDHREAHKVHLSTFADAVKAGALLRAALDKYLEKQGLWNTDKEAELKTYQAELLELELKLAKGGMPLLSAQQIALKMRNIRGQIKDLISVRLAIDNNTAEAQADNMKFNYLVCACLVYNSNKKRIFNSLEDYLNNSSEEVAYVGAQELANTLTSVNTEFEKSLPENQFLIKYGFADESLHLINKEGKKVDSEGRLVDENGRYIDSEGNFVDKNQNRIDEKGDYVVDFAPFTDEQGNPVEALSKQDSAEEIKETDDSKTLVSV